MIPRELALKSGAFELGDMIDSDYSIAFPSLRRLDEFYKAAYAAGQEANERVIELEAQYASMSKSYADQRELREKLEAQLAEIAKV